MKKYLYLFAALAALVSCNREAPVVAAGNEQVKVNFAVSGTDESVITRSSSESSTESKINSFTIFVFNSDGSLDVAGQSSTSSVQLSVCCGSGKKVYALVNPGEVLVEQIAQESQLDDCINSQLMENDGTSAFEMSGRLSPVNITSSTTTISVPVKRLAAKVCIESITNNLNPALGAITVQEIFLTNVTAQSKWFSAYTSGTWANKRGRDLNSLAWMRDSGLNVSIANGENYQQKHYYYCYPNDTVDDSTAESWCPRHTRLVIKAKIKDVTCYYVISLNQYIKNHKVESNCCYVIRNLSVKHIGSSDPDLPSEISSLSFEISVTPWTSEYINSVVI